MIDGLRCWGEPEVRDAAAKLSPPSGRLPEAREEAERLGRRSLACSEVEVDARVKNG
jgi:hypothetical protein